eukprot:gnl/MRDRNA2_/MRDRNA2_162049_c0_seq1.p1 gnl/MRDRNA2_/MRDRNA2_162049_c0~~gnl/MRDRNA2_/MRDRNA2_162049_c0_seq1.p1  ORF type:complete len:214 (+),score=36.25 gnl/MRDRNA2_/MRDRNA2_162049_c0_seq1:145-786(+)
MLISCFDDKIHFVVQCICKMPQEPDVVADTQESMAELERSAKASVVGLPMPRAHLVAPILPHVNTPSGAIQEMLELSDVGPDDLVFDLGCGDGRVCAYAALEGATAVGVDWEPELLVQARERAERMGVESKCMFYSADFYSESFLEVAQPWAEALRNATVIYIYPTEEVMAVLEPWMVRLVELGTRVVTYNYHLQALKPAATRRRGTLQLFRK